MGDMDQGTGMNGTTQNSPRGGADGLECGRCWDDPLVRVSPEWKKEIAFPLLR
jgi:hypothetical protein